MGSQRQLSRIALRKDQILEVQFGPIPEPPPEMAKLPGVETWFSQLKISRERDISSIDRMLSNLRNLSSTLTIESRTSDPANPVTGQIWLRVDL